MTKSYDINGLSGNTPLRGSEYTMPCVDGNEETDRRASSGSEKRSGKSSSNNAGKEAASVAGCSANNDNPSARTLNGNNALSNGNDNYCGAFAVTNGNDGKHLTTCSSRTNILENRIVTDGYGQCDYGSLDRLFGEDKAESNANASGMEDEIWQELRLTNSKRKLKNLKRFFLNPVIVGFGVDRCLKRASKDNKEVIRFLSHRDKIVERIIREMRTETYHVSPTTKRKIKKHTRDGKDRNADIYSLYDRCVINVVLVIIRMKFMKIATRNVYSGIERRSLFSNDRKYCMVNQIRRAVMAYPDIYVQLTDIHHFYETLSSKVALGVMFKTVVCPFTRRLLAEILLSLPYIAIGGTLSQLIAITVTNEMDREILKRYHPKFYGVFGDDRIIIADRQTCIAVRSFEMSYLSGRYGMEMKGNYSLHRVSNGFRFCKNDFKGSTVRPRAELRRNAIRGALHGPQHYAGYNGILMKTDSAILRDDIEYHLRFLTMKNSKGMELRPMAGKFVKIEKLENREVWITDYKRRPNGKESGFYFSFQLVSREPDGTKKLYVTRNGSQEIKEFFRLVETGEVKLPYHDYIRREGLSYYLEQYHTSPREECELICEKFGIK